MLTTGPELLIIDDRMDSVALLLRYFQGQPVSVMVALNGQDGLRKAQEGIPDVILLDVSMPQMNGFEVCQKLKSDPRTSNIPVLFLSGNVSVEHKLQGFAAGAVDYIVKPFSSEEVLARVYVHFKRQHLELASSTIINGETAPEEFTESSREGRVVRNALALLNDPKYVWQGVEALASKVGVIEKKLTDLFRHQFGMSVNEYQINQRLEKARGKLSNTRLQIQRIAEDAGYNNASDFSRAFRNRYGLGPREYRKAGSPSSDEAPSAML